MAEDDPKALAEAYVHENLRADAAQQTVGMAWLFALVPAGLTLVLLSALLGEWVWKLVPLLFVAAIGGPFLARLVVRWRSELPIDLPGHGRIEGARKRRLIAAAAALVIAALAVELLVERTTTLLPLAGLVTRTLLPKGRVRCAAVSAELSNRSPLAVRRPWNLAA